MRLSSGSLIVLVFALPWAIGCQNNYKKAYRPDSFEEARARKSQLAIAENGIQQKRIFSIGCDSINSDSDALQKVVTFNRQGAPVEEIDYNSLGHERERIFYEYQETGIIREKRRYRGNGKLMARQVYNDNGDLEEDLRYGANGKISQNDRYRYETEHVGREEILTVFRNQLRHRKVTYTLDERGQILREATTYYDHIDGTSLNNSERVFDHQGNPTAYREFYHGKLTTALSVKYSYDNNRLVSGQIYDAQEKLIGERYFEYDDSGWLVKEVDIKHPSADQSIYVKKVAFYDQYGDPIKVSWHNEDETVFRWEEHHTSSTNSKAIREYNGGMVPQYQCKQVEIAYF